MLKTTGYKTESQISDGIKAAVYKTVWAGSAGLK